jgi:hypothetical protein
VDGSATLERDGRIDSAPLNMPLLSGDRLRTANGRVEVRFADNGRLFLDGQTSIDVLSDDLIRLVDGRVRLTVARAAQQVNYRVDSPSGSVRILEPGDYRVALLHGAQDTQLEFAVASGGGEIFTDQGTTPVRAGERAYSSAGLLPSYAYPYNSANADDFDRWVETQHESVSAAASESAQYLPPDMGSYAPTFDQYGDWRYQDSYGYVWYPRVAAGWHPYYYGRWAAYPAFGWTWITADRFGYPTHHYGRWGFSAGSWYWIPSSRWGPAYVSWAYAPSYVSWCPLGYNNAAVFSIGYYNVGPAYYGGHYGGGRSYNAWTTMPHAYFGRGYPAHLHGVDWDRAGYTGARPQFTEARTSPSTRDFAVPRSTAAVRFAGSRPLSVGGATRGGGNLSVTPDTTGNGGTGRPVTIDVPRYINRGDQIVRSQTGRPVAPRDPAVAQTPRDPAVPRTAAPSTPSSSPPTRRTDAPFVPREGRGGDNPAYRPAPASGRASSQVYDRAVPRTVPAAPAMQQRGGYAWDNPAYRPPSYDPRSFGQPQGNQSPGTFERTLPRQEMQVHRSFDQNSAPQGRSSQPPPPRGEYQHQDGGNGRPGERTAPPSRPSGGERAAPRSPGSGHGEARAPSAGTSHGGRR